MLVAVQYQIPNDKLRALIGAAHPLRLMRLRNGAQQWQLFRDLGAKGCGARSSWSKAGCSTCACWIA